MALAAKDRRSISSTFGSGPGPFLLDEATNMVRVILALERTMHLRVLIMALLHLTPTREYPIIGMTGRLIVLTNT